MSELSPQFRELLKRCATCGGPMPCALHDAQLREAMLLPPERSPWAGLERTDIGCTGFGIAGVMPLQDEKFLVAYIGKGELWEFAPKLLPGPSRRILVRNEQWIAAAFALHDGTFLVGGDLGHVTRYDRRSSGAVLEDLGEPFADDNAVLAFRELSDRTVLIGGEDGRVARLDLTKPEGERFKVLVGREAYNEDFVPGFIRALDMLPDGTFLLAQGDYLMRFDTTKHRGLREEVLVHFVGEVGALCPLPDGTYLAGLETGEILHVDLSRPQGSRAEEIADFGEGVSTLTLLSPTSFLVTGDGGTIARYDIPEAEIRAQQDRKLDAPAVPPMPDA